MRWCAPGIDAFQCSGQYSTDKCLASFECDTATGKCVAAPAGSGVPITQCRSSCKAPPVPKQCSVLTDIMFAMDGSCSIKADEWVEEVNAVHSIANEFTFGASGTNGSFARMGIVQFGWQAKTYQKLTGDKTEFMKSLKDMPQDTKQCHTVTSKGLKMTKNVFDSDERPHTNYRAAIVVTDGLPTDNPKDSVQTSAAMQKEKIDVFAVYVCEKGNCGKGKAFMDSISSKPASKYSFAVTNWKDVQTLIASILANICKH